MNLLDVYNKIREFFIMGATIGSYMIQKTSDIWNDRFETYDRKTKAFICQIEQSTIKFVGFEIRTANEVDIDTLLEYINIIHYYIHMLYDAGYGCFKKYKNDEIIVNTNLSFDDVIASAKHGDAVYFSCELDPIVKMVIIEIIKNTK